MTELLKPDFCVIGAGAGGLSAAAIAASFGVSVVLVEQGEMGGTYLNRGCVRSKALLAAANRLQAIREASRFGLVTDEAAADLAQVRVHVESVVNAIEPLNSAERFTAMGVRVIRAPARFSDEATVVAGDCEIKARHFVLATGSQVTMPAIAGLESVPSLTSDTIFDLAELPEHLIVHGADAFGVELAQAYRRLGSQVTLVDAASRILPQEDPEMAAVIARALQADGITIRTGFEAVKAEAAPGGLLLHMGEGPTIAGSHLLVATKRRPVTDNLGLEGARINVDASGIIVDRGLRTSNPRVYAIGDCASGAAARAGRLSHVASHQAGLVLRNALFHLPISIDDAPVPRVIYTDPELAVVGLSEEEAKAKYRSIRILRWPLAENDRARAEHATAGHVKAIATPRGQILGCAIAGAHAGELISPWTLAIAHNLKISDLAGLVFPYPTFSEVTKRAAVEFVKPTTQSPWVRRFIGLARIFG